jgi:hypothetical protein
MSLRKKARRRNAVIIGDKELQRGPAPTEVLPMEETIPFPQQPSEAPDDETEEFLELLLRILEEPLKLE